MPPRKNFQNGGLPTVAHKMHSAPPMEKMSNEDLYTITLSPPDERHNQMLKNEVQTEVHYRHVIDKHMLALQKGLRNVKLLKLYPELSPTGRLHYHGYIMLKDVFMFYYADQYALQQIGSYEIDTIGDTVEDMEKYDKYCKKQEAIMRPYIENNSNWEYPIMVRTLREDT